MKTDDLKSAFSNFRFPDSRFHVFRIAVLPGRISGTTLRRNHRSRPSCPLPTVLCLLALVLTAGCGKKPDATAPTSEPRQTLRVAQRNEPATLDPHLATLPDEFFIIRALGEGLVSPNPDGVEPLPAAAESWTVSADGRTWTFTLRADAQWSNGDPVRAGDFVASYRRALSPAMAAPKAQMFFAVNNATAFTQGELADESTLGLAAPDDRTLVITLEHPVADFLALAASGPWIPVHPSVARAKGSPRDAAWTRPGQHIGNGPFILQEWTPNRQIVVARNPRYWDAAAVKVNALRFVAFDNGDAEERAYRGGQVDVTMAVPASKLDVYRTERPAELRTMPLHETRYLTLNLRRAPLSDPRVRQALGLALDRTELTDGILKGGQRPAFSYIPPGLGGYEPDLLLRSDPARARALLAEAGYPEGRGFPRLELAVWGVTAAIPETIQRQWKQHLGIEVSILQREAKSHLAALAAGEYDIGFITAIPDYDSAQDLLADLVTGGAGNYPRWSNQAYDRLVLEAMQTPDRTARRRLQRRAEAELLRELPLIPLYFNSQNFLVRPEIQGWQADALWTRYYKNVRLHEN